MVGAPVEAAAATRAAVPKALVEPGLAPARQGRPDATTGMDDLAAAKAEAGHKALRAAGIDHRHLPGHSPDLAPVEPGWSKLETRPRAKGAPHRGA